MKIKKTIQHSSGTKLLVAPKLFPCLVLLLSAVACGCQPLMNKKSMIPWGSKKNETKIVPDRILAVWTDTVLHQQGQTGVRGFGGRVYFYEKDNTDPIEAEGSLAVYAFNADDDAPDSQKPLRKFVFTPEQLAGHMSKTSIGPSYSIWLPWSAVGDPPQKLSLITRFEGIDGGTTISDPVIKLLPGVAKKSDSGKKTAEQTINKSPFQTSTDQGVQQASFSEAKGTIPQSLGDKRPVETIELPPGFQRHLKDADLLRNRLDLNTNPVENYSSEITTQVFDAKNPTPQGDRGNDPSKSSSDADDGATRFFKSPRPDRSNIRNGSWLKPERRLQDGIERKQDR